LVFSSNNTTWAHDSRAEAFLNSASNSPRNDQFLNTKIMHAVSMTPHAQTFFVTCTVMQVASLNLYIFSGGVGKFGNMFLIDIPFKGWQGRSNFSLIVHAVSNFACGVNDTACTMHAVSMTPHASCMRCH
jgi:hypothetical protein